MTMAPTEAERRFAEEERTRHERERYARDRKELITLCPRHYALDAAHLALIANDHGASNNTRVMVKTLVIRGLVQSGYSTADVATLLGMHAAQVEHEVSRDLFWPVPVSDLATRGELARMEYSGRKGAPPEPLQ